MHEMSIAESLVELIEEEARKEGFTRVRRIEVEVGALGHVEPVALHFCFDAIARGTVAAGASLNVQTVPGMGCCSRCGSSTAIDQRYDLCPICGSYLQMTAGGELRLAELEVE